MAEAVACAVCGRSPARAGAGRSSRCRQCEAKAGERAGGALRMDCRLCGNEFPAKRRSDRYCSDACRAEAKARNNREYVRRYLADPEKYALAMARARAYAARRYEKSRGGGRPKAAGRAAGRPRTPPRSIACRLCGRTFELYGGNNRAYCRRCTAKADREIARVLRVDCKECGKKFPTTNRSVRYCSSACRAEGLRRSNRKGDRMRAAGREKRDAAAAHAGARTAARRAGKKAARQGR